MVSGGHRTDVPPTITYPSVGYHETVSIYLTMVALNDMSLNTADIMSTYIKATRRKKVYTISGPEFGLDEGKTTIIIRSFYGLKSVGEYFQNHLDECMKFMVFKPCLADPDMWMRTMKRSSHGFEH